MSKDKYLTINNNYSTSLSWIWSDKITNERVARVGYNHFISNKGEWNNCFSKSSNRVLPPSFISTILQSGKFLNLVQHFPYDVKLRLLAHSRRARNAIVGAENLLNIPPDEVEGNIHHCYIATLSLNKMSTVIGWFLVTCPWSNSNVPRPGYNCAVVALTKSLFVCFCYTLNVWSLGKLVSFVFPRVLMFPEPKSRETSGLEGKQN